MAWFPVAVFQNATVLNHYNYTVKRVRVISPSASAVHCGKNKGMRTKISFPGSSGNVSYTGLAREDTDTFVLHIQARTADGEVANLRRRFQIGQFPKHMHCDSQSTWCKLK